MESFNWSVTPFFRALNIKSITLVALLTLISTYVPLKVYAEDCPAPVEGKHTYKTNIAAYNAVACKAEKHLSSGWPNHNGGTADCPAIRIFEGYDSSIHLHGYYYSLYEESFNSNFSCKQVRIIKYGVDGTYKKECKAPFDDVDGECATFCPVSKPGLDLEGGGCFSNKDKKEEDEICRFNPVVVSTGDKTETEVDIQFSSPFPLEIKRTYQSTRTQESKNIRNLAYYTAPTPIPGVNMVKHVQPENYSGRSYSMPKMTNGIKYAGYKNWQFLALASLTSNSEKAFVKVSYKNETVVFDKSVNGNYLARNLRSETLILNSSLIDAPWEFRLSSGEAFYFSSLGQLIKRTNLQGYSHYFSPVTSLASLNSFTITDDFSNSLKVTYTSLGPIIKIEASNGITIDYGYDNIAGNLTTVKKSIPTDPNNPNALTELTKTYHYENGTFPYALTGITDEKGVRYATWVYDAFGRVIQSNHINGVDNGTLTYEANTTTAANVLGKSTKYNYATVSGAKRLVTVEGVATESCAAANQAYTYYDNGRIKTQTDWESNVTYFEYNSKGQVTKRTEGYGTPEAYTVETLWHDTFNEPSVITYPDKQEKFTYNTQGKLINKSVTAL